MIRTLRAAPVTLPCAVVVVLLVRWLVDGGGYAVSAWAPGTLLVVALLAIALLVVPNAWSALPREVAIAGGLLFAYTLWTFVSIAWASDPGAAYTGAARMLLCTVVFALFALWPQDGRAAELLLAAFVLALGVFAAVLLTRIALADDPRRFFGDDRLLDPTGYPNASAVTLSIAALPAIMLAAGRRTLPIVRALCAAAAVVLLAVALLALSRGTFFALPICFVVLVALVPSRLRTIVATGVIGACTAIAIPKILDVGDAVTGRGDPGPVVDSVARWVLLGALVAFAVTLAVALWERGDPVGERRAAQLSRVGGIVVAAVVGVAVLGGLAFGHPVRRVDNAWHSFKGGYGSNSADSVRLVSGLGSGRYDYYRVGLDVFRAHPIVGVGADNFQEDYLRRRRTDESPRYPHSIEIKTLAQTGIVGALLLFGAFAAAALAAMRAMRSEDPRGRVVAGAALAGFAVWLVHGSADWFLEFGGIAAAAFALLGLCCGLAPRREAAAVEAAETLPVRVGVVAIAVVLMLAPLSLWAADHETKNAARVFASNPKGAQQHLDRAASLNPFSGDAESLKGSIALRYGALGPADVAFAKSLDRNPDDQYAVLERGAIASALGRRDDALRLLTRAVALSPRDANARSALATVRRGGTVDVQALNRTIFQAAADIGQ